MTRETRATVGKIRGFPGIDVKQSTGYLAPPASPAPARRGGPGGHAGLVAFVADAPEGERNGRLYWAACRVAEEGGDPHAVLGDAAEHAGLDRHETHLRVRGALHRRGAIIHSGLLIMVTVIAASGSHAVTSHNTRPTTIIR